MKLPTKLIRSEGQDIEDYVDLLYEKFLADLDNDQLTFLGKPLRLKYHQAIRGRGYAFRHCVTKGKDESNRIYCDIRCERIPWIKYFIENALSLTELRIWEQPRTWGKSRKRHVIWHEQTYFAVIIEERATNCLLWTTFVTDRPHKVETFRKEHALFHHKFPDYY